MEFEKYKHVRVNPKGLVKEGGEVETTGCLRAGCGCELEGCNCSEGYWVSITMPLNKKGIVEGIKVKLSKEEYDEFKNSFN